MNITKSDVEKYLSDVFVAVRTGRFQISPRQKIRTYTNGMFLQKMMRRK